MKWWKHGSGYWMGWIVAAVVSAGCILLLAARMFAYETFCRAEELCLREWVSALSGVLAVLAAFASLAYVAKQLEQASKHHRDAMKVQLQRTRTVARRASRGAQELRGLGSRYVAAWGAIDGNHCLIGRSYFDLLQQTKELLQAVSDPVFGAFEEEIDFVEPQPAAQIKEALEAQTKRLEAHSARLGIGPGATLSLAEKALGDVFLSIRYAEELMRRADEFLSETDALVRP